MPKSEFYARRLVKGSVIVFTAYVASEIVGVFLRMFLTRSLTVAEYGLFYFIFAFISFLLLFRNLALGNALVKYIPEFVVRKQYAKIKSSMISALLVQAALGLIISAALLVFSDHIALAVFRTLDASLPIKILSIWFFVASAYNIVQDTFRGFQNMSAYASINFFNIASILLLAMFFVGVLGLGVSGVAFAYLAATVVMGVSGLTFLISRYQHVFREKASITKPLLKKLLLFAIPIFIGGLGDLIVQYTDTLTIGVFRTLPEVGYYQAAQPAAQMIRFFPLALGVVLFPMISELWARRKLKLMGQTLHFLTKFTFILIMPAAFVFIAFPNTVINLLFGSEYIAGAMALQILGVTAIVHALYHIFSCAIVGIGRPIVITKVVALMACFNLVGDLTLTPLYGIEGAAAATLGAFLIGLFLMFYYTRKFIKFTVPALPLLKTLVGGVLTLLFIFGLKSILALPPWPEAFAVMILGLLFYGGWILATKTITKDDLRLITRIVPMPKWLVRIAERFVRE